LPLCLGHREPSASLERSRRRLPAADIGMKRHSGGTRNASECNATIAKEIIELFQGKHYNLKELTATGTKATTPLAPGSSPE